MPAAETLSIVASMFNAASMLAYFRQLRRSESIPNPATWLIWVTFTLVNLFTYVEVTEGSPWIPLLAIVNTTGTLLLFAYSLARGKFARVGVTEVASFLLALLIGTYWKLSGNAVAANVALQLVLVISYYPTYAGLARGRLKERPLSWAFSTAGYAILAAAVFIERGADAALAFPLVNVLLNAAVTGIASRRRDA